MASNIYYFSFLIHVLISKCHSSIVGIPDNFTEVNTHLEKLANHILDNYFVDNRCIVVMSEKGLLQNLIFKNTVAYYEAESGGEDCYMDIYNFLKHTFEDNCDGYIVQLKDPICAMKGWEETNLRDSNGRHNPKFFFLPVYPSTLTYAEELMSMRVTDISQYILAAEIIENKTDWTAVLSTNNFYQHPYEANRQPKIYLDEWHPITGFKESADLYPDKILNLNGKDFRIAISKYPPYTIVEPVDGFEVLLAKNFCQLHNCTTSGVTDEYYWGTIYDNKTGNGVLGLVYMDEADIGVMACYVWLEPYYYIDYSTSYLRGEVTLLVPAPKRLGGWIVPFLPFHYDLWLASFLSLFVTAISLYYVTKASIKYTRFADQLLRKMQFITIGDSLLRALGLAVLQCPSSSLINSPNRYLFTSFELLYFVLTAMYSASLASFLTVPLYTPPIDTFHDFAESGITWYVTHEAYVYLLAGESSDVEVQTVRNASRVLPVEQIKEKAKEGKHAFPTERCPGGHITEDDHITAEVIPMYHIMKDRLFGSPVVTVLKKGGPYQYHYNRYINMAVEHGLTLYWEAEASRNYLNSTKQAEYDEIKTLHVDNTPQILQVSNITGTLYLYGVLMFISFILFIVEIVQDKCKINIIDVK